VRSFIASSMYAFYPFSDFREGLEQTKEPEDQYPMMGSKLELGKILPESIEALNKARRNQNKGDNEVRERMLE